MYYDSGEMYEFPDGTEGLSPALCAEAWAGEALRLRLENNRLRASLEAIVTKDIDWYDDLVGNVEQLKVIAQVALRGEGKK